MPFGGLEPSILSEYISKIYLYSNSNKKALYPMKESNLQLVVFETTVSSVAPIGFGGARENRTPTFSLQMKCSAIILQPHSAYSHDLYPRVASDICFAVLRGVGPLLNP